jgi:hypothetical protein
VIREKYLPATCPHRLRFVRDIGRRKSAFFTGDTAR